MQTQDSKTASVKPPATGLFYCHQAKELLEALDETVRDLVLLQAEQFDSFITGDLDSRRFDELIHRANQRKQAAKYVYLHHLGIHNCSKYVRTGIAPEVLKQQE
jgi:hypothetical protein